MTPLGFSNIEKKKIKEKEYSAVCIEVDSNAEGSVFSSHDLLW
jgi:hypothetical protein